MRWSYFTWREWTESLSAEIARVRARGEPDLGDTYYQHWLSALEDLLTWKGLVSLASLVERKEAWSEAYLDTPHGQPVKLKSSGSI